MLNGKMTNDPEHVYRAKNEYWSQSSLKEFKNSESPSHFYKRNLCKNKPAKAFNPHFALGTVLHNRVELGKDFDKHHGVVPKSCVRNGPTWKKFCQDNPGKMPVRQSDWDQSLAMYEAILAHPGARALMEGCKHEESFYTEYQGSNGPIKVKGRTDLRHPTKHYVVDVKTTACGCPHDNFSSYWGPASFKKSVIQGGLHYQAAYYKQILKQVLGHDYDFIFLAVEKTYPYHVSLHTLSPELQERGKEIFETLETLDKHVRENNWPSYGNLIHVVEDKK